MRRTAREITVDFAELSDPGRDPTKQINEDACGFAETPLGLLSVVCDGMGGHTGGTQASQTAVQVILNHVTSAPESAEPAQTLRSAVEQAGAAVFAIGGSAPTQARPGSTCVSVLLTRRGAVVAHAGDSRLMLIRSGHLTRLTRDHSLVQQMVEAGVIAEAAAPHHPDANKITRALGMRPDVDVELHPEPISLFPDDVLLLTSDGVTDLVADEELLAIVTAHVGRGPAALCHQIIQLGNARGGHDNLTVQVLHVLQVPAVAAPAARTQLSAGATVLLEDPANQGPATQRFHDRGADVGGLTRPTLPDRGPLSPTVVDGAAPKLRGTVQPTAPGLPRRTASALPLLKRTLASSKPTRTLRIIFVALAALVAIGLAVAWYTGRSVPEPSADQPVTPAPEPPPPKPAQPPQQLVPDEVAQPPQQLVPDETEQQLVPDETEQQPPSAPDAPADGGSSEEAASDADRPPFP